MTFPVLNIVYDKSMKIKNQKSVAICDTMKYNNKYSKNIKSGGGK